jgi:cellulose biosynthesis protein BcsQ
LAKIVVINTKGGVGKSTISLQVAVSFIYQKTGKKVELYEFDDENQDAQAFIESDIVNVHHEKVEQAELRDRVTDIILDNEDIVFDIGANKTANYLLDAFIQSGMLNMLDLVIIPLMDGENDAISAVNVYSRIRESNKDIKIIFALNRVNTSRDIKTQFNVFLGDKRGIFNSSGIVDSIPIEDQTLIELTDSDTIKYSKNFGQTVWELAKIERSLEKELIEAIKNKEDKHTIKVLSFKNSVQKDCKKYADEVLSPIHEIIDFLLKDLI